MPLFAIDYSLTNPPRHLSRSNTPVMVDPKDPADAIILPVSMTPLSLGTPHWPKRETASSSSSPYSSRPASPQSVPLSHAHTPDSSSSGSSSSSARPASPESAASRLTSKSYPMVSVQTPVPRRPSLPSLPALMSSTLGLSLDHRAPPRPNSTSKSRSVTPKARRPVAPMSASSVTSPICDSFESCMEGGIKHEGQSATLGHTGDMAQRHLERADMLFASAMGYKRGNAWATLRRATVLLHLSNNVMPVTAISYLRNSRELLWSLDGTTPHGNSGREVLAAVCSRLSRLLLAVDPQADDATEVWEGEVGRFACEALDALEDVAGERMDRARMLRRDAFEGESPALADMFLALADAAGTVALLATDAETADAHTELAEHALDQAANMATLAATASVRPAQEDGLIARVQLASGRAASERLRHMFHLGVPLDEDDFALLIGDMAVLATETRNRAATLKGSKGALANRQAYEAARQLGDTKVVYANLLRCVWRSGRPTPIPSTPSTPGLELRGPASSTSHGSGDSPSIPEEPEDDDPTPTRPVDTGAFKPGPKLSPSLAFPVPPPSGGKRRAPPPPPLVLRPLQPPNMALPPTLSTLSPLTPRTPLSPLNPSAGGFVRRASDFPIASSRPALTRMGSSVPHLPSPRRSSWLSDHPPTPTTPSFRRRRSSPGLYMGSPVLPSADLARAASSLAAAAVKHYKTALSLLASSDIPHPARARDKADVLAAIAHASLFRATITPLANTHSVAPTAPVLSDQESPAALFATAEVYAAWAAREVGWSFLIEGTPAAARADRRTGSWEADEAGKRAVLLAVRVWWYRSTAAVGPSRGASGSSESGESGVAHRGGNGNGNGSRPAIVDSPTSSSNHLPAAVRLEREKIDAAVHRLRDREGVGPGDIARFLAHTARLEGAPEPVERAFWRGVQRVLGGGVGGV